MQKFKLISIFIMLMFTLNACNTMEGAGQDMQSAGEAIEDEAND